MYSLLTVVGRLLSWYKYPRYAVDLCTQWLAPWLWRLHGIDLGPGIVWSGFPIMTMAKGSRIRIGKKCRICSRSANTALGVNHPVILRTMTSGAELLIGEGVRMSGTAICAVSRVVIGDRCVIGANVTISDTDFHSLDPVTRSSATDALKANFAPVTIGNDVFIGSGSYILKGVNIGNAAIVGAGSVVTRDIPSCAIFAGNPARQVATLDSTTGFVRVKR